MEKAAGILPKGVPYSSIDRFEPGFTERWFELVRELTLSTQFIGGEWVKKCEAKLAQQAEVTEVKACANGTDAIQIALKAVGVGPGDVVLIPDLTFWATFETVCTVGAKPVTVDVDPQDFHLSVDTLKSAIDRYAPKAVILVHLYGWVARDTLAIRKLCRERGIPLIEDSAQAWGARIDGKSVFTDALISTTSFYPGKVLGAAGDGGAILTQDKDLAHKCWQYANHGRISKYEHALVGWNSRLDSLQAAYLWLSLDHTPARLESRRNAAAWYRKNVRLPGIDFRAPASNVIENGYISVALVDPAIRPRLMEALNAAKIGYAVVYPGPMSQQPGAKEWLHGQLDQGHTARICKSMINLPCFAGITLPELEEVKRVLQGALA